MLRLFEGALRCIRVSSKKYHNLGDVDPKKGINKTGARLALAVAFKATGFEVKCKRVAIGGGKDFVGLECSKDGVSALVHLSYIKTTELEGEKSENFGECYTGQQVLRFREEGESSKQAEKLQAAKNKKEEREAFEKAERLLKALPERLQSPLADAQEIDSPQLLTLSSIKNGSAHLKSTPSLEDMRLAAQTLLDKAAKESGLAGKVFLANHVGAAVNVVAWYSLTPSGLETPGTETAGVLNPDHDSSLQDGASGPVEGAVVAGGFGDERVAGRRGGLETTKEGSKGVPAGGTLDLASATRRLKARKHWS